MAGATVQRIVAGATVQVVITAATAEVIIAAAAKNDVVATQARNIVPAIAAEKYVMAGMADLDPGRVRLSKQVIGSVRRVEEKIHAAVVIGINRSFEEPVWNSDPSQLSETRKCVGQSDEVTGAIIQEDPAPVRHDVGVAVAVDVD